MDRSRGFGSHKSKLFCFHYVFPLDFPSYALRARWVISVSNSLALITCKPIIQKVRHFFACFAIQGFRFYFTLALLFFSTFPHGTLFSIGVCSYLALDVLFTFLQASFRCSTLLSWSLSHTRLFYSLWFCLSPISRLLAFLGSRLNLTPISTCVAMVLASSISLTATLDISLDFFSFSYLDDSVRWVFFLGVFTLWDSLTSYSLCQGFRLFFRPYHIP